MPPSKTDRFMPCECQSVTGAPRIKGPTGRMGQMDIAARRPYLAVQGRHADWQALSGKLDGQMEDGFIYKNGSGGVYIVDKSSHFSMKTAMRSAVLMALGGGLVFGGCARKHVPEFVKTPEIRAQLISFAAAKERQARSLASAEGKELPPKAEKLFSAIENAHWEEATNDYAELRRRMTTDSALYGSWWNPVLETFAAAEQFTLGDDKYAAAYGNDIIQSIPPGSIYFGGTDPGRFIVTAMEKSQIDGDPFFGLTQNALEDGSYLDYLRSMYGNRIYIPTAADLQKCFDDYYRDYQERRAKNELLPGEDATNGPDGKWRVNSYMSVIQVKERVAKVVFEKNTNREFYVEESFPFEWMYPDLEPHGLIFKMNHQPLTALSEEAVRRDQEYWTKTVSPMIGDWLNEDTPAQEIQAFAEKVFLRHDFNGFRGDPAFVENPYAHRKFSKDRSSIAGLYAWRAEHTPDAEEKARMSRAADFAFRQAWALCPDSLEAVFRYVAFLMEENRTSDALIVAETAAAFRSEPSAPSLDQLVQQLKQRLGTQ